MKLLSFVLLLLTSVMAQAGLDEFVISTEDKTCSIHYLTNRTKYNWTIKVKASSCKDGWVDGDADVQLYSPTKQLMETLSGFFSQGYWLDNFPPVKQIIERGSPAEHIQSLSFLLGKDEEADITYVGQLRAVQPENRTYSAFQGCPDFRVLVVVPEGDVFQNPAFQNKIAEQGVKYARFYCPTIEVVALFGATSMYSPKIIFQMQVDPATEEKEIIPVSEKKQDLDKKPLELRTEETDVLLSVEPSEEDKTIVSYIPKTDSLSQEENISKDVQRMVLGDMRILSNVSGQSVLGKTVVHINQVLLDGTGLTDLPEEIQLKYYPNLKTGWAVVKGDFKAGVMRVFDVQFCKQEWCTDVP